MSQVLSKPRTTPGSATAEYAKGREVLLEVTDLKKHFPIKSGILFQREVAAVKAVDGVSFKVYKGETLGLVGESGCGKSTTGRTILQLYRPTAGSVKYMGQEIADLNISL